MDDEPLPDRRISACQALQNLEFCHRFIASVSDAERHCQFRDDEHVQNILHETAEYQFSTAGLEFPMEREHLSEAARCHERDGGEVEDDHAGALVVHYGEHLIPDHLNQLFVEDLRPVEADDGDPAEGLDVDEFLCGHFSAPFAILVGAGEDNLRPHIPSNAAYSMRHVCDAENGA